MTFWNNATEAEKLVQVRAASEIGMTSIQTAKNLGTTPEAIRSFAQRNDIHFNGTSIKYRKGFETTQFRESRDNAVRAGSDEAFHIFPARKATGNLFARHPLDGEAFA